MGVTDNSGGLHFKGIYTNLWNSEIYLQVDYINFVNLQCRLIYILGDNGN